MLNKYGVGLVGDGIAVVMPPRGRITADDATEFAAWLLTMAVVADKETPQEERVVKFMSLVNEALGS